MHEETGPGGPKCATSAQRLACEHMRRVSTEGRIERCACSVCGESLSRPVQWPFMAPKRVEVAL